MNKRVLSLVLALVMILTMVPMTAMAAGAADFSDVEQGKWYYTWIDNVVDKGFYAGYTDGTFRPNVTMTRAMFVMVLANMEEAELDNSVSAFKDVEAGKWYTGATKWAADRKIVAGYTDGSFKPDAIVTREQMATIMQNYINWRSAETGETHVTDGSTAKFADDAKISNYAKEAVANCREWGLVDGYTDSTFRPQNGSTRAEVAAVISKLDWLVNGGGGGFGGGSGSGSGGNNDDDDTPTHTHRYTSAVTNPTCTEGGYTTYTCTCGHSYTADVVGALGHDHSNGWLHDAYQHWHECTRCNQKADHEDHTFVNEVCTVCGREENVTYYTLTYHANFGSDVTWRVQDRAEANLTVSEWLGAARDDYEFINWNSDAAGTGITYAVGDSIALTGNMDLYAQWNVIPEYHDFILDAVHSAVDGAESYWRSWVDTTAGKSSLLLSDINVNETIENGARKQEVTLTGDLNENSVENLGKAAVMITAGLLINEEERPSRAEVEDMVDTIIDKIESDLGIDITRVNTRQSIKDEAWNQVKNMKSVWSNFNNGEGAYYTSDITLSIGNAEIVVGIDEKNTGFYYDGTKRTLAEAAAHMGAEVAKQLYDSLKEASNSKYISAGKLSVEIGIDFSAPKKDIYVTEADANGDEGYMAVTYKQNAEQYPLSYPLTVNVVLKNTIDTVTYKYVENDGSYIKLTITEAMQTKYLNGLEKAIKYVLSTGKVKTKADGVISGAVESVKDSSAMTSLENALVSVGYASSRATDLIDTAMKHWLVKNANYTLNDGELVAGNMYQSNIYKLVVDGDATFNNSDIMNLADTIANGAATTANQKLNEANLNNSVKDMIRYIITPENLKDILDDAGADIDFDVEEGSDLEQYVLAAIADKMNGLALGAGTQIKQDIADIKTMSSIVGDANLGKYSDFFKYIKEFDAASEKRPYTTTAVKNAAHEDINEQIQNEVEAAVEGHEYYDYLQLALKAKDIDAIQDAKLGTLAEVFELDVVEGLYEDKAADKVVKADRFVDELVAVFKRIPTGVTVSIDGNTMSKATLADVEDAKTAEDIMKAGVKLLSDPALKELCIRDFAPEEGVIVRVSGAGNAYGLHLVIDVK